MATIVGNSGDNLLNGTSGDDKIYGVAGDDTLKGAGGNDILLGMDGEDALYGGSGIDTASYENASGPVVAALIAPDVNEGEAEGDTYISIENLRGSIFNDELTGDNAANRIAGGAGDDTLWGAGGRDRLFGEDGDDVLGKSDGIADVFDGGSGFDFVDYGFFEIVPSTGVTADLLDPSNNTGRAAGDSYFSIEGLHGTNGNDTLRGNDGRENILTGENGNDMLVGRGGYDLLYGGDGDDRLNGGEGSDDLLGGLGADTMNGGTGADNLRGDGGRNTLTGGAGQDYFVFTKINIGDISAALRDTITDFTKGADKIDLDSIDDSFNFIGQATFSGGADGEVRYVHTFFAGNPITLIIGDIGGDGDDQEDFEIALQGHINLTAADFDL